MVDFKNRSIVSINDLNKTEISHILKCAKALKLKNQPKLLDGKIMASCFFEPSTRTRLSFETAMQRLGGQVMGFTDGKMTSAKKGESVFDSMKIIGQYADIIVMRHPLEGTARRATEATSTPVINGGDGANQHPTQTLLDLFTIQECQKRLENLNIALVGDLKYGRTVHSLAQVLQYFSPKLYFVAPECLKMPKYICDNLKQAGVQFSESEKIESIINKVDILYMTRIQAERFSDPMEYENIKDVFVLGSSMLKRVKPNMKIMHPLPRVNEIQTDVDATPYAHYFQQAENGVYVRQALLGLILGKL